MGAQNVNIQQLFLKLFSIALYYSQFTTCIGNPDSEDIRGRYCVSYVSYTMYVTKILHVVNNQCTCIQVK